MSRTTRPVRTDTRTDASTLIPATGLVSGMVMSPGMSSCGPVRWLVIRPAGGAVWASCGTGAWWPGCMSGRRFRHHQRRTGRPGSRPASGFVSRRWACRPVVWPTASSRRWPRWRWRSPGAGRCGGDPR